MPYNPALPSNSSPLDSSVIRGQLTGLKTLIDAAPGITAVQVDAVNTLPAGNPATVDAQIVGDTLHLTFSIPQGNDGAQGLPGMNGNDGQAGPQGEVTNTALAAAIADALVTAAAAATANSSAKSNAVDTLDTPFANDPPTVADMEVLRGKLNELITALRR